MPFNLRPTTSYENCRGKLQDAVAEKKQKGHVQVGGGHAGSSLDDKSV